MWYRGSVLNTAWELPERWEGHGRGLSTDVQTGRTHKKNEWTLSSDRHVW